MTDTNKMFRTIINGQNAMKQEILTRIDKLDTKIDKVEKNLGKKIDTNTKRLDKIGSQVAYLEDDAPTREEHGKLDKRVKKVEIKIASL